ncbi:unnamed protein product, partial [Porites lobata]
LYHHALPVYLSNDLEGIQKRALSIISPGLQYVDNLTLYNMSSLTDRRIERCNKLFELLHHLLPPKNDSRYNLRN